MKSEHALGMWSWGMIVEKDANIFTQLWVVGEWHWWKNKVFFFPPFEWFESRDMPCGKRFLCQHQREGEIAQQFHPSGGAYQTWHIVELQKQKSETSPGLHSFTYKKKKERKKKFTIPVFSYCLRLGETAEITSPAFKLESKDNLQNKKQKSFLRVSAGSPKRNIRLGEAIPLIRGG